MADFDSVRMPVWVSLSAVGGPGFLTSIATMASGAESRNQDWELERGEWTIDYSASLPSEWRPLMAFFRVIAKGRANTFRFKDWTDFECPSGEGVFVPTLVGSPTLMQMVKRYTFEGITHDRYINKPINGKVTLVGGGSIDYATGLVTGGSPTGWYGEFDCQCRLEIDKMRAQVIDRNPREGLILGWNGIEVIEVTGEVA